MGLSNLIDKLFIKMNESVEAGSPILRNIQHESISLEPIAEDQEEDVIRMALNVPEVLPCLFDKTVEFWLKRIQFWGKLKIVYIDVDGKRRNVSVDEFEEAMAQPEELIRVFGTWDLKKKNIKSFEASREFYDQTGKRRKETYIVDIELDKDLEKAFKGKF